MVSTDVVCLSKVFQYFKEQFQNLGTKVRHFFDTTKFFGKKIMSRGNFSPLRPDLKHLRRLEIVNYWHDNGEYVWQEIENRKWKKTESEG